MMKNMNPEPEKHLTKKDALWLEMMWQCLPESKHAFYRKKHARAIAMIEKALGRPMETA